MKKTWLFFPLVILCLLLGCSKTVPDHSQPPSANADTPTSSLEMPDAMKEYAENPKTQWMTGILAVVENTEMLRGISRESYEVFTDPGDEIRATVTVQNGLKKTQRFELMVFADGVPVAFTVDGEAYRSYPIDLAPEQKAIEMEFEKDFARNLGRLDFVMSFAENPQAAFHTTTYTLFIEQDGEALVPESLCTTVEQRVGLQGRFTGEVCDAWIWNEGVVPNDIDQTGPGAISLRDGETVLLEAIAAKPGLYRTVLVVDGTPVDFELNGTKHSYLDWESTGTNMIQLPIKLEDVPPSGSIYTVTTPLDADALAQPITASRRIELTANGEE